MYGITFQNVATKELSLDEIKPLDREYGDDLYNGDFIISWFDGTKLNYAYWREELEETGKPGWGTQFSEKVSHIFPAGGGFWLQTNDGLEAPVLKIPNPFFKK